MNRAASRWWDFPAAFLLLLALFVACQRLVATGWTEGLGFASLLALLGALLGLPLGYSRFGRRGLLLLALGYSLTLLPMLAGAIFYPGIAWLERLASLGGRLGHLLRLFAAGQELQDTFLFVIFISLVCWFIGLTAGLALTRSAAFGWAVLPAGLLLTMLEIYDHTPESRSGFLAVYVLLALLLLGRITFVNRRNLWNRVRLRYTAQANATMNLLFLIAALTLVGLAWSLPTVNRPWASLRRLWEENTNPVWERTGEDLDRAIAGLERGQPIYVNTFYGESLVLGQQAETGNAVLFRIRLPVRGNAERYYWRVRVYDEYQNDGWRTGLRFVRPFTPAERSLSLPESGGLIAEFSFRVMDANIGLMVTPPNPVWVSRPARLTYFQAGDEALDPLLFEPQATIMAGEEYLVHALVVNPTVQQLRSAGTEYPAWVREHYLQLPPDLPPAIADLARQITAGAATPYDKAVAITDYLRREITYSPRLPPTPSGRNTLAWFLFDHKAGFCNYYATAEVVLLRAVGVPARLAVGFSEGQATSPGWRTVLQRHAHAWPEVYFPGLGWVEFEPTASEPPLSRPDSEAETQAEAPPFTPPPAALPQEETESAALPAAQNPGGLRPINSLTNILLTFAAFLLIIVGLAAAYALGAFDRLRRGGQALFRRPLPVSLSEWLARRDLPIPSWLERWARLASLGPSERLFQVVYRGLRRLGVEPAPARTPAEAAALLEERLPQAAPAIRGLLHQYQVSAYDRRPAALDLARQDEARIRQAVRRARWRRLLVHLHLCKEKPYGL
ncbi:MAG: transglutaminase domain-containing protein [Anaerolineales bacterium]